jgi:hypothetical protein
MVVVRVPNMANILSNYSRYIDVTHIRGYTEWSLFQLLDTSGFHQPEVIKSFFGSFEVWKRTHRWQSPLAGLGLREALNVWVHRIFSTLRGSQLRPTVYSDALTVRSYRE